MKRGPGPFSASTEIQFDPDHHLELRTEGLNADEAAVEVILQANVRQTANE